MRTLMRYVKDINMWAIDRSMESCSYRTAWCERYCYCKKFEHLYPEVVAKYLIWEKNWYLLDGFNFKQTFKAKRRGVKTRFRLCTKGEPFERSRFYSDVDNVRHLAVINPKVAFWVPTKAYSVQKYREYLETHILPIKNIRLMASIDTTVSDKDWQSLIDSGWSTLFVGIDNLDETPQGKKLFKCPKTFKGKKGHCAVCKAGCFSTKRVDVHLKYHG